MSPRRWPECEPGKWNSSRLLQSTLSHGGFGALVCPTRRAEGRHREVVGTFTETSVIEREALLLAEDARETCCSASEYGDVRRNPGKAPFRGKITTFVVVTQKVAPTLNRKRCEERTVASLLVSPDWRRYGAKAVSCAQEPSGHPLPLCGWAENSRRGRRRRSSLDDAVNPPETGNLQQGIVPLGRMDGYHLLSLLLSLSLI